MYNPDPAHYMLNTSGQNYHTRKQSYGDIQIRNTRQFLGYQNIHQDIKYKRKWIKMVTFCRIVVKLAFIMNV